MRKYAFVDIEDEGEVKKVMVYEADQVVYVFTYITVENLPCTQDFWFETLIEAEEYCEDRFGVLEWIQIEDPRQEDPHDLIPTQHESIQIIPSSCRKLGERK
ncbi:hypothetical protein PUW24_14395 [Paenibacillus urinalis]|uniref:Uncharacterized protein n=1 Tax=Paenibacillus urinalis TaxID=521520 RepID=A0AAX3N5E7_9BACL|nr:MULTISPECIES: hypothetical protein [Paenibacillus]WDH83955.1 hypothetical protein PUW23_06995 [Paenibacillus urinalis]WDH95410.1 hypothetical protein PUW24_14395 [Paenibacillus urinalis]WDI03607.1 hypothetical protein PUW25_06520 [Paenibacillus urinalis]SDW37841.1 hypothetical protein SAMN05518848_1011201 [Paenibacillus sp. PDC88]GAK40921.1 hypothetical protein TCA2_3412 [Paenibacillus sp. TCA20]